MAQDNNNNSARAARDCIGCMGKLLALASSAYRGHLAGRLACRLAGCSLWARGYVYTYVYISAIGTVRTHMAARQRVRANLDPAPLASPCSFTKTQLD